MPVCKICNLLKMDMDMTFDDLCKVCFNKAENDYLKDKSDKMLKDKRQKAKSLKILKVNRAKICKVNRAKWLLESKR